MSSLSSKSLQLILTISISLTIPLAITAATYYWVSRKDKPKKLKKSNSYNQIVAGFAAGSSGRTNVVRKNLSYHVVDESSQPIVESPQTLETWYVMIMILAMIR